MTSEEKNLQLQKDLSTYLNLLAKAADTVVDQDVSNYPVFVVFKGEDIGVGLAVVEGNADHWTIHISTLEELVSRRIVEESKVDDFRHLYKEKTGQLCLLVWQESEARFVFLPRIA